MKKGVRKRIFLLSGFVVVIIFVVLFIVFSPRIFDSCRDKYVVGFTDGKHYANSTCYFQLAVKTGNPYYCKGTGGESMRECYTRLAMQKGDISYCDDILPSITNYSTYRCYADFYINLSLQKEDASYCEKINFWIEQGFRDGCYYELAQHTKNLQYCDEIKDSEDYSDTSDRCYADIQIANYIENNSLISTPLDKSENFTLFFNKTIGCNSYFLFYNESDTCFYYHRNAFLERFCNYDTEFKSCFYWYGDFNQINTSGLSLQEMQEICDTFVHPGLVANCKFFTEGKNSCLNYAQDNDYLKAICNLEGKGSLNESMFPPRNYLGYEKN
jgi:hypothetical protein